MTDFKVGPQPDLIRFGGGGDHFSTIGVSYLA